MIDTSVLTPYTPTAATTAINTAVQGSGSTFAPLPNMNLPTTGDMKTYYDQAFATLQPYYSAKLAEAKGDLEEAKRQITYDYQTGTRYNQQDTNLATERQQQDFESAMKTFGLTTKQENDTQTDTLNKRGIATVEGPNGMQAATGSPITYDQKGNPVYAGNQGQAGNEISMLREDQGLRKEAETRAAQRNLTDIGIKGSRQAATLGETQQSGTYSANRTAQQAGEQLGQEQQQQAYSLATDKENQRLQAEQVAQQKAASEAEIAAVQHQYS